MNKNLVLALFAAAGLINVIGHLMESPEMVTYSKPVLMPILLYYVFERSSGNVTPRVLFLTVALVFSWGGDMALMAGENFFLLGVGLFFLAQITYILLFYRATEGDFTFKLTPIIPFILYCGVLLYLLVPNTGDLTIPVVIYAISLLGMASFARLRQGLTSASSFNMVAIGAVLFLISDSILAIDKFGDGIPNGRVWTMATYIMAQFLIANGILHHPSQSA